MAETHDCGGDAAAFVLGAMDSAEAEAFRRRLETCSECREEVAMLQEAARALPLSVPQLRPSGELRQRVLAEVRADARERRRAPARRRSPAFSRPVLAGLSAVALAVAAFAGAELAPAGAPQRTRVVAASVGDGQLRILDGHGELLVHHLRVPPPNRIYEVWVEHADGRPTPTTSLFSVTAAGDGATAVPGSLAGVRAVLVTLEPAGGTRVPTTRPVIIAHLS